MAAKGLTLLGTGGRTITLASLLTPAGQRLRRIHAQY